MIPAAGRGKGITAMKTDLEVRPIVDEEEPQPRFHRRRLIRWAVVVTLGILAVLAAWQEPLYALRH
jgi:hypothetical protein